MAAATITTTQTQQVAQPHVLRLKAGTSNRRGVQWAANTVDNEHLGRKSSKKCCIFHKAKAFGESDSEESDSDWEGFDQHGGDGTSGGGSGGGAGPSASQGKPSPFHP